MPCKSSACKTADYWVLGGLKNLDCNLLTGRRHSEKGYDENNNPLNILLINELNCESSYEKWFEINNKPSKLMDYPNLKLEYLRKCYKCEIH